MADDYLYFLINKFANDLQEAVEEWKEFPLVNDLKEIRNLLPKRTIFATSLVKKLRSCLFELNELLADSVMIAEQRSQVKSELPSRSAKELWNLIRARQKLIRIKKKLDKCRDIEADERVLSSSILVLKPEAFNYFHEFKIQGLENQVQTIENELLKTGNHKAIGIIGMGGSGKTALARSVFHRPNLKNRFELRLWIDLSEATDAEKEYFCILVEKSFGCSYIKSPCQYGLDEVLSTLHGYIGKRRCLIVLDGVWHGNKGIQDFVDEISRGLDGAVIVTSRLLDVAKFLVGEHGLYSIQPLDPEACWFIFMDSMNKKRFSWPADLSLAEMEEEIRYRCDGLPLAAKTLAEILTSTQMIEQAERGNIQQIMEDIGRQYATNHSKRMLFEINVHDRVSLSKAWYRVIGLPGVNVERTLYYKNRFQVTGTCNPEDIAMKLGRFCHVELISVQPV